MGFENLNLITARELKELSEVKYIHDSFGCWIDPSSPVICDVYPSWFEDEEFRLRFCSNCYRFDNDCDGVSDRDRLLEPGCDRADDVKKCFLFSWALAERLKRICEGLE